MHTPPVITGSADEVRKTHLKHEASVQAIGALYLLGAFVVTIAGVVSLFNGGETGGVLIGVFLIGFGLCQGWIGTKLRKLDPKAKTPATLLACIGLLGFPLGTLINAYVLYLLHSAKGKVVFSEEYRAVIAATPHIKYKMSVVIWILLGLVVALLLFAVIAVLVAK